MCRMPQNPQQAIAGGMSILRLLNQINCIMNKLKVLTIAVLVLLATNVFFLIKFLSPKPEPVNHHSPREMIIEKLNFDDNQVSVYEKAIDIHRSEIDKVDTDLRRMKGDLYRKLAEDTVPTEEEYQRIASKIIQIEKLHYHHFLDIKQICRSDQLDEFKALTKELPTIFGPPGKPGRKDKSEE